MNLNALLLFLAIALPSSPQAYGHNDTGPISSEELGEYFVNPSAHGDVVPRYKTQVQLETDAFLACSVSVTFEEAMAHRARAVNLYRNRQPLGVLLKELQASYAEGRVLRFLDTTFSVTQSAIEANRLCAEHAANLKVLGQ